MNKPISPRKRWKWIVVLVGATLGWFGTFEFLREMRPQAFEVTVGGNHGHRHNTGFRWWHAVGCIELPLAHGMPPVATLTREFASAVWKLQPPYTAVTIRWHHVKVIADGSSCTYNGKRSSNSIQIYPTYPGKAGFNERRELVPTARRRFVAPLLFSHYTTLSHLPRQGLDTFVFCDESARLPALCD